MSEQHYVYKIEFDDTPDSPREWDNLGKMVCFHSRRDLGDESPRCDPDGYLSNLACEADPKLADTLEWLEERGLEERYRKAVGRSLERNYLIRELFLYEHSGLSMSSGTFEYPCDSSIFGIIYVAKAKIRQEYGFKVITKDREQQILGYLDREVETYDEFLTGQVYGYRIFELPEGVDPEELSDEELEELEEVDSLWGIYGEDYAEQVAKESVAYFEEHHAERLFKREQAEFREAGQQELDLAA